MEAIKCDVCGKYYTRRTDESSSVISCVKWIEFGKLKMGSIDNDLCNECTAKLYDFLKGKAGAIDAGV